MGGDGGGDGVDGAGRMGDDGMGQLGRELMEEVMEVVVGLMEQR